MNSKRFQFPTFVRQVGTLSIGALTSSVIAFVATPILTRIYSPEEFGIFNALFGYSIILSSLGDLSMSFLIPQAENDREASDLFWLSSVIGLVLIPPITCILYFLMSSNLDDSGNKVLWIIASLTSVTTILWAAIRYLCLRSGLIQRTAISTIVDTGGQTSSQLLFSRIAPTASGLLMGFFVGKALALLTMAIKGELGLKAPTCLLRTYKKYLKQGFQISCINLLNQFSTTAIGPLVVAMLGSSFAGQLSLASRVLAVPAALIGSAVASIFYPKLAKMKSRGEARSEAVATTASTLLSIAIPIFGVTAVVGPEIFEFAFGSNWRNAGVIAAVLAPWLALNFVSSPISSIMTIEQRNLSLLVVAAIECFLRVSALLLGQLAGHWLVAFALYSIAGIFISVFAISWSLQLSAVRAKLWWLQALRRHMFQILAILLLLGTKNQFEPTVTYSFLAVVTFYGFSQNLFLLREK